MECFSLADWIKGEAIPDLCTYMCIVTVLRMGTTSKGSIVNAQGRGRRNTVGYSTQRKAGICRDPAHLDTCSNYLGNYGYVCCMAVNWRHVNAHYPGFDYHHKLVRCLQCITSLQLCR